MRKILLIGLTIIISLVVVSVALAQSTTKSLSTNFTLINFGSEDANVVLDYRLTDGSSWPGVTGTSLTIDKDGGQAIVRQYDPIDFSGVSGSGSVVVSSSQPLGAVAQILARPPQLPSSGAYSGFASSNSKFYVPLVSRRGQSASGTANSQIIIQNTNSTETIDVNVTIIGLNGLTAHVEAINDIPASSSFSYDLDGETSLTPPFFGSAVVEVQGSGEVVVVSNFYLGADSLQTFNAFPSDNVGTSWLAPLVTSRLANGLSAPVTFQNLSGGTLNAGDIDLICTANAASSGGNFTVSNSTAVVNNGSYAFNPVTDTQNFPTGWFGSCRIEATGNGVAFVQMRFVGTGNAAAYEAINASGTDTEVLVPLIAKRLVNGFATALTVQNLDANNAATVDFTYVPSPDYVAAGGSSSNISVSQVSIPAGGSVIHNHRITSGSGAVTSLPTGWYGTVTVSTSSGTTARPIAGFVQLTNISATSGDTFMAHNAFTQP